MQWDGFNETMLAWNHRGPFAQHMVADDGWGLGPAQ